MDSPASKSQSQWKPVASASLDTALLSKRPNPATAAPARLGKELLLPSMGSAARGVLGPCPALTTATSKSSVPLPKRKHPWCDHRGCSSTGSGWRDSPSAPKPKLLHQPPVSSDWNSLYPAQAAPRAGGTDRAGGCTELFASTQGIKFPLFPCGSI